MAQWSRADRTIYTRLVYYGPAFGGKTTNLKALHACSDPQESSRLLSLETADDRTLFFDLLPLELGEILGYHVAMKLFTVPGQVKYDTTRQVILSGADAIVFVADSTTSRRDQNVWSLQNLQMNMRQKRLDSGRVPVLYQFNKQDRADAAPPAQVAKWLGLASAAQGQSAVALAGQGVVETFLTACQRMLLHLIAAADDRTRREIDVEQLSSQLDRVLAPYLRRAGAAAPIDHAASPGALEPPRAAPIVLAEGDLVERAVQAGVRLGESASAEQVRADRLERETEALRALSETLQRTGSSFDAGQIIDEALASTRAMLRASAVTLLRASTSGQIAVERSWGHPDDPLCRCAQGREFLAREGGHSEPRVIADLSQELSSREAQIALSGLGAAAIVPVGRGEGRMLVVYLPVLAHGFRRQDVRLLAIIAGHLAVGLEKARLHQELAAQRDRLEATVAFKTRELCEAQEAARAEDPVRERLLSGLSQGIRTPLTALVSVGRTLRDRACSAGERRQLAVALVESAESLERQLDQLFRLIDLEDGSRQLVYVRSQPGELLNEALALAGCQAVSRVPASPPPPLCGDRAMLIRALANVIDDAARSSNSGSTLEITAQQGRAATASGGSVATVEFSVCDPRAESGSAGPEARFSPFERGCDGLGLYEARVIAHRHGGMLEFRPRAGGVREFRLSIPLEPLGAEPTGGRLDPCIR